LKLYQAFTQILSENGVDTMFGLMGDANMQYVTDFIDNCGGTFVGSVHESGAVSMADGYGRVANRVGVASVTHGPGLTNTITALTEAVRNQSQLLLITGDTKPGWDLSPQNFDIGGVVTPTGAGYERVYGADTLLRDVQRALRRIVVEHRPVVLNLPVELLASDAGELQKNGLQTVFPPSASAIDAETLDDALGIAASGRKVVVLAGRGAVLADAHDSLVHLAGLLNAPLATTLLAKDYFRGHPQNLGICGTISSSLSRDAIAEADCILAFGASLNKHTAGMLGGKRIVQCDTAPSGIGKFTPTDVSVLGDAKAVAASMAEGLSTAGFEADDGWATEIERRVQAASPFDDFTDRSGAGTVDSRVAMIRLDEILPLERTVVTDSGRFLLAPWRYLHVADPTSFIHTTNFASIGLGLGTAIGAATGRPEQLTVAVLGDGGFMMHMAEFSTAVRDHLRLVVIVLNDAAYGADYITLQSYGIDPTHAYLKWPEFAPVAEALGARGLTVRSLGDLDEVGHALASADGPVLVDVKVDPTVDIWQ
jgi:thiamine pyrophosphate-dependent acetolactate synthase large subunit-like protein